MYRPCTVCSHARRAEIDWRLAFTVISPTELARDYGVSRDALRSHRRNHLPGCLAEFQASADALRLTAELRHVWVAREGVNLTELARTLGVGRKALERHRARHVPALLVRVHTETDTESTPPLFAELARLYEQTLDALASAESAALSHIDTANNPRPTASHAAIARYVDDARQHVGSLTRLFLDAAKDQRLAMPLDPQTQARIATALTRVMERGQHLRDTTQTPQPHN